MFINMTHWCITYNCIFRNVVNSKFAKLLILGSGLRSCPSKKKMFRKGLTYFSAKPRTKCILFDFALILTLSYTSLGPKR